MIRLTPAEWRELRLRVFERDNWTCLARVLDPEKHTRCFTRWGDPFDRVVVRNLARVDQYLTLDHVLEDYGGTSMRAEHIEEQLATECWGAHLGMGPSHGFIWATSKRGRDLVRRHLQSLYDGMSKASSGDKA